MYEINSRFLSLVSTVFRDRDILTFNFENHRNILIRLIRNSEAGVSEFEVNLRRLFSLCIDNAVLAAKWSIEH